MPTLLQSKEINRFLSIAEADLPPCEQRTIKQLEEKEFRDCIGFELYEQMQAALVDYSTTQQYVSQEYTAGQTVVYKGDVYQAVETTSTIPTNATGWKLADKFSIEAYNALWCDYLGEYLSWVILRSRLAFMRSPIKGGTITALFGSDYRPASDDSYSSLQKVVNIRIGIVFGNMDHWLNNYDSGEEFENYKGLEKKSCKDTGKCNCGNNCLVNKKRKTRMRVA